MTRHIGIFSGSFDPIHAGHIAFAKEAVRKCGLETVIFMPERFPRGKPNVSPISERITELEIALVETPFKVLTTQADQFTVDETLNELELLYPKTTFIFLIGSDVAFNLHTWKNVQRLVTHYSFAVGMRTGDTSESVENALRKTGATYSLIQTQHGHLASRQLRHRG